MGKIKAFFRCIPIKFAFFLCVSFFMLIAFLGSVFTCGLAKEQMYRIEQKYYIGFLDVPHLKTSGNSVTYYNFQLGEMELTPEDNRMHGIYRIIDDYSPFFWCLACLLGSTLLFYRLVLQYPLSLLRSASSHIANNNLDFHIDYTGTNELAELCHSFEIMRRSLDNNIHEILGMNEQRKRLNDAYTHELRTPVAVLKGYADMILKYFPDGQMPHNELLETVEIMSEHIERITAFTESMNTIQKLEDIAISPKATDISSFLQVIENSADVLCRSKGISIDFQNTICADRLFIDSDAVLAVFENLFGNALRFAKERICISFSTNGMVMNMVIQDDGKGFTEKELKKAGRCYYSGKSSDGSYHFGLGLYIAILLCEKHGGRLLIENAEPIGARLAASFNIEGSTE